MKKTYLTVLLVFFTLAMAFPQVNVTFTLSSGASSLTVPAAGLNNVGFTVNLSKPSALVTDGNVYIYAKGGSTAPVKLNYTGLVSSGSWGGGGSSQTVLLSGSFNIFPSDLNNLSGVVYARYESSSGVNYKSADRVATVPIFDNIINSPAVSSFNGSGNPSVITGVAPKGGTPPYSFQWQSSTTSLNSGFSNIASATTSTFDPPTITLTTHYRRIVTSGSLTSTSNPVTITINSFPPISNNLISYSGNSIIYGVSGDPTILTGSTPTGGSGSNSYTYQWQSSITSPSTGFNNISSATSQNFDPGSINQTTHYTRIVTSGNLTNTSNVITITLRPLGSIFDYPIDIGNLDVSTSYGDNRNPTGYGNEYGNSFDDIFYKFNLVRSAKVSIYNCKSDGTSTVFYLLDNAGNLIQNGTAIESCDVGIQVDFDLQGGVYYVVHELQDPWTTNTPLYIEVTSNGSSSGRLSSKPQVSKQPVSLPENLTEIRGSVLYPNPGNHFISFNLEKKPEAFVQIIDINGVVLSECFITESSQKMDVSDLPSGFYLTKIFQGNHVRSEKLIIRK